jgi:phosphonoacetaldehyde hydrolase
MRQLRALVLDWSGTTVDFGNLAPVAAITRVFGAHGIVLTSEEARQGIHLPRREQIKETLRRPRVAGAWEAVHGAPPTETDAGKLLEEYEPQQFDCVERYSDLIPGVAETVDEIRSRDIRIGTTTAYSRATLERILPHAARQGYVPDCNVTPDEVGAGRPAPLMCYLNAVRLGVWPLWRCVKIGDTPADIEEGRNAGMWTIAVASGGEVGLSLSDWESISEGDRRGRLAWARARLREAAAHFVVDSLRDCLPALDEIEARLEGGETAA